MDAQEVVETIHDIYDELAIMPNLREHMIRVAAVADFIIDHWNGKSLDRDLIVAACLLHDIGNIMKIKDFDSVQQKAFMGEEAKRVEYWKTVQEHVRQQYGEHYDEVRDRMLRAIGVDKALASLVFRAKETAIQHLFNTHDDAALIYLYADNRVAPSGFVTLSERIADAKVRYPGYYDTPARKAVQYEKMLHVVEQYLTERTSAELPVVSEAELAPYVEKFRSQL
jgi:predicted HD phosphohydrolase